MRKNIYETKPGNPKPVGWLVRILWHCYQPVTAFKVNSKLKVYRCRSSDTPILLAISGGEFHVVGIQLETAKQIADYFHSQNSDDELLPGDCIKIWKKRGQYRMIRRGSGMPHLVMDDGDWGILADIFSDILLRDSNRIR